MYPNPTPSLFSRLLNLKNTIKWTELLEGTKKTLDVVNQAIPIYYQVKPIVSNAKTLFNIANIVNSSDTIKEENTVSSSTSTSNSSSDTTNSPIFYL